MLIAQWPEGDRRLWQRALAKRSVLDDASVATRWRPITQRGVAKSWGHWLGFLERHVRLDASDAPASQATPARVQAYVDDMRARGLASATIHMRVLHISRFLEATDAGSCPAWLLRFIRRLSAAKIPMRDDRSKLKPASVLVDLGHRLIARAETDTSQSLRRRAATCRDGLMILILCCCPVRVGNLGALQVGLSLVREGDTWWLRFNADQTKGKRPINLPLPGEVTPLVDRYVRYWRPVLVTATSSDTGFVWLRERDGTPMQKLGDRVASLTRTELGQTFNAHLFRKLATTELSIRDPAHVGAAQALLGHARYETTQKAYNLSRTIDAARKVQATLAKLRRPQFIEGTSKKETP
jgi:integrase